MNQHININQLNKGKKQKEKKQKTLEKFNLWLSKIGNELNISQLSNYK